MADDDTLTRRGLRHSLLRARNARIAESRDDRMPVLLTMSPATRADLLVDGDPGEVWTMDFEAFAFMGIPISGDPRLELGIVQVSWPAPLKPAPAPEAEASRG